MGFKAWVSIPNRDLCKLQQNPRHLELLARGVSIPNRDLCKLQPPSKKEIMEKMEKKFQSLIGICVSCNYKSNSRKDWDQSVSIPNRDLCKLQPEMERARPRHWAFQSLIGICVSCNKEEKR